MAIGEPHSLSVAGDDTNGVWISVSLSSAFLARTAILEDTRGYGAAVNECSWRSVHAARCWWPEMLLSAHISVFPSIMRFQRPWPQIRVSHDCGGCKGIQSRFGRAYIAIGEPHSLSLAGDDANGA